MLPSPATIEALAASSTRVIAPAGAADLVATGVCDASDGVGDCVC